jgi:outer membrane protein assembly factor BamD
MKRIALTPIIALVVLLALVAGSGCRRKKYENPIGKDTQQPDKVLYDKAVRDIERARYEVARITLNTLINTYDTSEYLAKAKLAIADSWFREGGSNGLAQAEAEYKDFILFYPQMEEAAESQEKICMIHYRQMEKPDRDFSQAQRADDECRQLLVQFPNSKFAPRVQQLLRNIQEVLAEGEFRVGAFYHNKGSFPAAANRLQTVTDVYPLFSQGDEALWQLGDSYEKMGARFRDKAGTAYSKIVRDYPLSPRVEDATKKLKDMELPVPEPDPVAVARMKYEVENQTTRGFMQKTTGFMRRGPNTTTAAKSGQPVMNGLRPGVPASVPVPAAETSGGVTDVSVSTVSGATSDLETKPDARQVQPGAAQPAEGSAPSASQPATAAPAATTQPEQLPSNRQLPQRKGKTPKPKKPKKEKK